MPIRGWEDGRRFISLKRLVVYFQYGKEAHKFYECPYRNYDGTWGDKARENLVQEEKIVKTLMVEGTLWSF